MDLHLVIFQYFLLYVYYVKLIKQFFLGKVLKKVCYLSKASFGGFTLISDERERQLIQGLRAGTYPKIIQKQKSVNANLCTFLTLVNNLTIYEFYSELKNYSSDFLQAIPNMVHVFHGFFSESMNT